MKKGQFIRFDLYNFSMKKDEEFKAEIIYINSDPLGRHEDQAIVKVNNKLRGIPVSRIKEVFPAIGEQLTLDFN